MIGVHVSDGTLADHRVGVLRQGVGPLLGMLGVFPGRPGKLDELSGAGLKCLGLGLLKLLFSGFLPLGCSWISTARAGIAQSLRFLTGRFERGCKVGSKAYRFGLAMIHVPEKPACAAILGIREGQSLTIAEQCVLGGAESEFFDLSDLGSDLEVSEFVDSHAGIVSQEGLMNPLSYQLAYQNQLLPRGILRRMADERLGVTL